MRAFNNSILYFGYILIALCYSCENEPYDGPLTFDTQLSCSDASDLVDTALNNFLDSDSSNFTDNCLAYKVALEEQLLVCPESSDEISELINDLNNYEFSSFFQVDFDNDTYFSLSAEAHIGNGQLTITGRRDNEDFQIILHQTTEGTYQLGLVDSGGDINTVSYFPDVTSNESWVSLNDGNEIMGEVTVSEINYSNLSISGTFSFTGINNNETKAFTNGIFINIPLTKDNEFFVLVDGVEFEETQFIPYVNEQAE
ncbi:DUF6252 family protein [Winogradskyella sp. PG-2]|uniref:DUF6252 family protein n=1 Tax=Winogradskyella sp. PG-2 TaxID=754409 RepID=UPI0004588C5E|nr:DUF6252 family protein [Winogradskyella sp. PG-2]BAO76533.1 hypothetical protein WPG_2303 [Winogradskyella sp. PG-2]